MHPLKKLIAYTIGCIVIWLAYEIWQSFKMNDEFYRCVATVAQNSSNHDPAKPILGFVYSGEDGLNLCMESKGYKIRDDPDPHCAKSLIPMCFERQ